MKILHVGFARDNKASGVRAVLPQYVKAQKKMESVAFYNFKDINVEDEIGDALISKDEWESFDIDSFSAPFNRPDIVIFHNVFSMKFIKAYKKLKKRDIPYVIVPHSSLTENALNSKKLKKYVARILWFNKFINNASAIHYLSDYECKMSKFNLPSFVIPNGIEVGTYEYGNIQNNDGLNIVYIGRKDIYQKGIDYFLKACGRICENLKKANVTINIYGPDYNGGDKIIEKLIKDNKLINVVNNNEAIFGVDKEKVLKKADIFVLPSRFEGHSVALLEAMAYGVPVFVTPGTGSVDEVEANDCGWTTDFNEESIAKNILRILDEKEYLRKKSYNAYNYVKNTYEWQKIAKDTIIQYSKIVSLRS